jgi:hypothetical protein
MTLEEKTKALKKIFWDYNTEKLPLDTAANGNLGSLGEYEFNLIFNRMLERLSWYELLDIVGVESLKRYLTKERIAKLRFAEMRDKYEFIRKILSGEPVSLAGWGDEYYQKIKHTLFSHRWYSTKQALL